MTSRTLALISISLAAVCAVSLYEVVKPHSLPKNDLTQSTQNEVTGKIVPNTMDLQKTQEVPPMIEEDVITLFFTLINEKRIPKAVEMLSYSAIPNDSARQAWGVQFNAFDQIKVTKLDRQESNTYKVTLDVLMKPESLDTPIPYYGFENGENTRWLTLIKEAGLWKITGIATGP